MLLIHEYFLIMIEPLNCRIDCTTREVCKFVLGFKYLAEFLGLSTLTIHVQRKCLNFHIILQMVH